MMSSVTSEQSLLALLIKRLRWGFAVAESPYESYGSGLAAAALVDE